MPGLQMKIVLASSSALMAQWKGGVAGILLGMCITYLLRDTSTFITPFYQVWNGASRCSSPQEHSTALPGGNMNSDFGATQQPVKDIFDERRKAESYSRSKQLSLLLASWEASSMLSIRQSDDPLLRGTKLSPPSKVPKPPHLENCQERSAINERLEAWGKNGSLPWTLWRGQGFGLGMDTVNDNVNKETLIRKNLYPPWVEGADEDNLPLTRKVQADIWQHQHPQDCQDPSLRFLLVDWETDPGFGMGAQIASMAGMLAIALNERRILVSNYYNRADHKECAGSDNARWSCYFIDETSKECRRRALLLAIQSDAWEKGLITSESNYTSKQIWVGRTPRQWGRPWKLMQPTTQIDGKLLIHHKASDRRWWRAQAVRYLMRFTSKYLCSLLNEARHKAFGMDAARMVLDSLHFVWPEVTNLQNETDMDRFVWKVHKPWVPRPLISIHVRQGDKAKEMEIFGLKDYMALAQELRGRFPHARSIWLSTEMQEVIEESKRYTKWWDIYYTNVSRQTGNTSMAAYTARLGRALSTNYPLVNFLLAAEADFFIGALGSTWCYLIDGMRTTGGKVMAGYLSVNKDRFW